MDEGVSVGDDARSTLKVTGLDDEVFQGMNREVLADEVFRNDLQLVLINRQQLGLVVVFVSDFQFVLSLQVLLCLLKLSL